MHFYIPVHLTIYILTVISKFYIPIIVFIWKFQAIQVVIAFLHNRNMDTWTCNLQYVH